MQQGRKSYFGDCCHLCHCWNIKFLSDKPLYGHAPDPFPRCGRGLAMRDYIDLWYNGSPFSSLVPRPNLRVRVWADELPFSVAEHILAKVLIRENRTLIVRVTNEQHYTCMHTRTSCYSLVASPAPVASHLQLVNEIPWPRRTEG